MTGWNATSTRNTPTLGITLMVLLDLFLFGVPGIIIVAVQMISMPLFAAGIINGVGHHSGYRNFECADAATNIVPWGVLLGGEELHNNHHAFPSSSKFSVRSWEFDIGWFYINGLERLRSRQSQESGAQTGDGRPAGAHRS